MRHWFYLSALMLTISMGACTSDNILPEEEQHQSNTNNEITNIVATTGSFDTKDFGSRTSITMGESTIEQPVWAENDSIGIYPIDNEKQQTNGDQLSFRITNGIGTSTCAFDGGGWGLKNSQFYCAYTPFNRTYYYKEVNELPVSMLGQKQKGNGSTTHMGKYDLQIAIGRTPENGKVNFQFQHQVCFLRMDLTAPIAATWKSITLESDASFTTEAVMNLASSTPTVTSTSTSNQITLELENITTTSENLSIVAYMMLLPVDLTDKSLTITLTDSENKTYSTEASITSTNHYFGAAKARWITADFLPPNNQIWYTSSDGNIITPTMTSYLGNVVSNVYNNGKGTITFDSDVTNTSFSFSNCTLLTSITLPNSVTYIGDYSFNNCSFLTDITIPSNLTGIGPSAFYGCSSLTNITLPNSVTSIGDRAFQNCNSLTNFTMSNKANIGNYTFVGCTSLTNITIPVGVTNIGEGAFSNCSSIASIVVEEGNPIYNSKDNCNAIIKTETNSLILGCKNTIMPNDIISITSYAFYGCNSLTSIIIPQSVTEIGYDAFSGCSSLSKVNVKATTPPTLNMSASGFYNCSNSITFYVPTESIEVYKAADHWKTLNILPDI